MIIWIDAQLSPAIAAFINRNFADIEAKSVRSLGLREAKDLEIFIMAKAENAIIMSKDADFLNLLETFGFPPQIIWITCGNTSNANMCGILQRTLKQALQIIIAGEPMVEISDNIN
ncbi:MAG: hypothetical protein EOP42_21685 [Sphingobacteriaceae bacterium]|nr:MAG: hypothetical protein EOP42_21685 [Sphingobacteriaceae bacterium]